MFKATRFPKPTFYLYGLICPVYSEIKYIGLSKNPEVRFNQHMSCNTESKKKNEWINKLKELGLKPELQILNTYTDRAFASKEEIRYIEENKDTLLNGRNTLKYPDVPNNFSYEVVYNVNLTMSKDTLNKLDQLSIKLKKNKERFIAQLISEKYQSVIIEKKRK